MKLKIIDLIAKILVVIGAINWGLVALDINLVTLIFGSIPALVQATYIIIGIAGLYVAYLVYKEK